MVLTEPKTGPSAQVSRSKKILVVDDHVTNLTIAKKALDGYYTVITAPSGEKALELLTRQGLKPSLILLDTDMPGLSGVDTIRRIKEDPRLVNIPVIMMNAQKTGKIVDSKADSDEYACFALGAVDYITKPFSVPIMQKRVFTHIEMSQQQALLLRYETSLDKMIEKKAVEVLELQDAVVTALLELVDLRNGVAGGAFRTGKYLKTLIAGLMEKGYYSDEINGMDADKFVDSARLYDIGEVAVPDYIMKKSERLTNNEFDEIKKHTVIGQQAILKAMQKSRANSYLNHAAVSAVSHHERWDGSGYPYGLSENEIPLQGRLVAIADVYEALVSQRPYKQAISPVQAVDIIRNESGRQFDPKIVEIFNERRAEFEKIASGQ